MLLFNNYDRCIITTILTLLFAIKLIETADEEVECGQYGFNCLDERTIEFCPIPVDGVTDMAQHYVCEENFKCDEDNPSFCTPNEPKLPSTKPDSCKCNRENGLGEIYDDDVFFNDDADDDLIYRRIARAAISTDEESTAPPPPPTPTPAQVEEESSTVMTLQSLQGIQTASPFECDNFGFYPDDQNNTLFWHCDVSLNGNGFVLRHMKCGIGRHFDERLRSCVLEGTVRNLRTNEDDFNNKNAKIKYTTDCKNRKPGKYGDAFDCHIYHLCLSKQFSPAIQLTFVCPRQTAYDCISRTCTIAAKKRCDLKSESTSNVNCTTPMRFRSIDDCQKYYVCFADNVLEIKCPKFYKFDDISLECLPENSAKCQEIHMNH